MMGKKTKQSPLFYYMNISDMIPEDHILRLINKYIDFSFIRKRTKQLYSDTGRPSIDPEVLIKMLLVGYLYGITSERRWQGRHCERSEAISLNHRQDACDTLKKLRLLRRFAPRSDWKRDGAAVTE